MALGKSAQMREGQDSIWANNKHGRTVTLAIGQQQDGVADSATGTWGKLNTRCMLSYDACAHDAF